jgi:hypothetical protein
MIRKRFAQTVNRTFDQVEHTFEGIKGQRFIGTFLVLLFVFGLLGIQLNRLGLVPEQLAIYTPTNHLEAIQMVFTMLLAFEVIGLLFSLVYSVSISVGKQVEILSLVLLRNIFKEISHLHEPVVWHEVSEIVLNIAAYAVGAMCIFVILSFYYRQIAEPSLSKEEQEATSFIIFKKIIAMVMMLTFAGIFIVNWWQSFFWGTDSRTFETFFTMLIFCDILIMLLSMRYCSSYRVAFRNSAFAVATLLIRVALITPAPYSVIIGVGSALLVLAIRLAYNKYTPSCYQQQRETRRKTDFASIG